MSQQSSQDKTEKASPQKVRKAREQGQIPRSKELTTAIIFIAVIVFLYCYRHQLWLTLAGLLWFNSGLDAQTLRDPSQMWHYLDSAILLLIGLLLPLFVAILVATIVSNLLLGGWLFHPAGILPKLSKLDPIAGIKRIFSIRSVIELIKSVAKVSIIFGLLYYLLDSQIGQLLGMQKLPLEQGFPAIIGVLFEAALLMGAALVLFGVIDLPLQAWQHLKELKMTKQELKEEYKNSEGRPEIKQRIRQIQQQFARRRIEQTVPQADVIIINPSHYAVAIKYDPQRADAPFVVAKGIEETALHIQRVAKQHKVEVLSSPPLTRAIYYSTQIDQAIPSQLYIAVAHILTYILQLKAFRNGQGLTPNPLPNFVIPKHLQR